MKMLTLRRRTLGLLLIGWVAVLIASGVTWRVIGQASILLWLLFIGFMLTGIAMEIYVRLSSQLRSGLSNEYRQYEALLSISSELDIRPPLPPMRGWAISPDFGRLLISCISEHRPNVIVEMGSGISSVIAGYCLKGLGRGVVLSLEHDSSFAQASRTLVASHGLANIVTIVEAPLTRVGLNGITFAWYDLARLPCVGKIDMLLVDGPPGEVGRSARYPALPLLIDQLSMNAVVLVDDSSRRDESEMIARWLTAFPEFRRTRVDTEKGASILRRRSED